MTDGALIGLVTLGVTLFFLLGVPVFLVIGLWVVGVSIIIDFTLANIGVTLFQGLSFFGLLALPLFILTGDLINAAGIAKRLSDFAYSVLGWLRGGMGMATLGACGLFAAISGSNAGTTATIGSIMQPEMVKNGYDERFSAATAASGGTVGIIIPPSIIFIVYGFMMNLSISDLFIAGMIPGAMMVLGMSPKEVFAVITWAFSVMPVRRSLTHTSAVRTPFSSRFSRATRTATGSLSRARILPAPRRPAATARIPDPVPTSITGSPVSR